MKTTSLTLLLALTAVLSTVGCSSKNYVKQQTTPLINKTNELDDMTAKNTHDIKDVDARAQAGIQAVQAKAADVDAKALAAGKQADDAQLQGSKEERADGQWSASVKIVTLELPAENGQDDVLQDQRDAQRDHQHHDGRRVPVCELPQDQQVD